MKNVFFALSLALTFLQAPAASALVPTEEEIQAQLEDGSASCAQAQEDQATAEELAFEANAALAAGKTCSSSIWCSPWEHCVGGVCKPKDAFNRCGAFDRCSLGERCVNGVCKR